MNQTHCLLHTLLMCVKYVNQIQPVTSGFSIILRFSSSSASKAILNCQGLQAPQVGQDNKHNQDDLGYHGYHGDQGNQGHQGYTPFLPSLFADFGLSKSQMVMVTLKS